MQTIVRSPQGEYFLRYLPGFKRYKETVSENEMVYFPFSEDSVDIKANTDFDDNKIYSDWFEEEMNEKVNKKEQKGEENMEKEMEEEMEEEMEILKDPFFLRAKVQYEEINMEEVPVKKHHSTTIVLLLSKNITLYCDLFSSFYYSKQIWENFH